MHSCNDKFAKKKRKTNIGISTDVGAILFKSLPLHMVRFTAYLAIGEKVCTRAMWLGNTSLFSQRGHFFIFLLFC